MLTANIIAYDGQLLTLAPTTPIERTLLQKQVEEIEIRLNDGRKISASQRKKTYALIADIADWNGHEPQFLKEFLKFLFCGENDIEDFSLSDVDMTTAKEFITYLIEFCFARNIPTRDTLLHQTDDIYKYLYLCLEHRKCAICNDRAEVHHVDTVGMGRDRRDIHHSGMNCIALCRKHHAEAHNTGQVFYNKYHVHGIKLDEYLCKCLKLKE